jgi:aminoglycoside phosphotransferase (APT) family kinase protein
MEATLSPETLHAIRMAIPLDDREEEPELLDVGFSSIVWRFGGTVVRLARNGESARGYAREVEVLRVLRASLPVAVPDHDALISAGDGFPFGAASHRYLPGRALALDDAPTHPGLADEIAAVLVALHRVPSDRFPHGVLPELAPAAYLDGLLTETFEHLRARLTRVQRSALDARCEECRVALPGRSRVICHGDPWAENMLVDEDGHLTALLDFQDVCLADPALDLAAQTYYEASFSERTIASYEERTHPRHGFRDRVGCYRLLRELGGLAYALRNDLDDETDHAFGDVVEALAG